jgi:FMN phosphatase YigB (HAD superfamily)
LGYVKYACQEELKERTMPPEIIVAIITGFATIVAAVIGIYSHSKKKDRETPPTSSAVSQSPKPATQSKFWDHLANTVMIVFGADYTEGEAAKDHPRLSLRDLKTAQIILEFLVRHYPEKHIASLPAPTTGWQALLQDKTDLVFIGGPVVNIEFTRHQSSFQQHYRLRMGRLCRIDGQRVYHVKFSELSPEEAEQLHLQPKVIEEILSKKVATDFALVTSNRSLIYSAYRRMIVIAGIKGYGTLGAALQITREGDAIMPVDVHLPATLTENDNLEMVIQTNVLNEAVDTTEIIEVTLNGKVIFDNSAGSWQPCELGQPCWACKFGEYTPAQASEIKKLETKPSSLSGDTIQAILFDLDDTLVDTFSMLITPLEIIAANRVAQVDSSINADVLAASLLDLRKSNPSNIESELRQRLPGISEATLNIRQEIMDRADPLCLVIDPEVKLLLRELEKGHQLFLLTEGDEQFQSAKINNLGIRSIFKDVIITTSEPEAKQKYISEFLKKNHFPPGSVLVVGNRLDKEIKAANELGIHSLWIRHGEGSHLQPGENIGVPDFTLDSVLQIHNVLTKPSASAPDPDLRTPRRS